MAKAHKPREAQRQLSFLVSGQAYVIPAERVLEVGRRPAITRVPNAPPALAGVMNFRGVAIPAVHLEVLVSAGEKASSKGKIIVYDDTHPVGLLIDEILPLMATHSAAAKKLDIPKLLAGSFVANDGRRRARNAIDTAEAPGPSAQIADERSLLAFTVSGQNFALPLDVVAEVAPLPTEVNGWPRSEAIVMGLLPLRGEALPLISVATLLGLRGGSAKRHHIVVTKLGSARVGLVVDELDGVTRIAEDLIEPVPGILQRGEDDAEIDAIARAGGRRELISILSPSRLFRNRTIGETIAEQSQTETETAMHRPEAASHKFIIFSIGDDVFGLPLEAVGEIVQLPETVSHVPNAPAFIAGVINLRGKALPVIDQRLRFNAADGRLGRKPRVIVLTIGQIQAGFIVDAVFEILAVPASAIAPAPPLPGESAQTFDRVMARGADGAMILLINPEELLRKAERDLLDSFKADSGAASAS